MIKLFDITDLLEPVIKYLSEKYWEYSDTDIRKWVYGYFALLGVATIASIGYLIYTWEEMHGYQQG
jgi:hypothetical protein